MNQSEMILEFIDGTLDGGREQRLFDEMAQHPELRAELRQYVMIGDAVRADREAFSPPADVERRLLGGLGLIPIMEAGGAAAGAAVGTASATAGGTVATAGVASSFGWLALAKLKSALLPLVVGLILGSAAGGGGVYLAMENSSGSNTNVLALGRDDAGRTTAGLSGTAAPSGDASAVGSSSSNLTSSANTTLVTVPGKAGRDRLPSVAKERSGGEDGETSTLRTRERLSPTNANGRAQSRSGEGGSNGVNGVDEDVENSAAPASLNRNVEISLPQSNTPLIDRETLLPETPTVQRSSATLPPPTKANIEVVSGEQRFAVEVRKGFLSQPFADNNAREVSANFLQEDIVLGGFYATDRNWYVGLEAGRERFAQTLFYNQAETLFVEQRPALMWGGVALGRKVNAFDLPFFVQGTFGASQYGGPMARGRVGFDLAELFGRGPSSAFSLPLSFEASSLVYTYNGQYLVTGNWGLSGGMRLRFGL